MKLIVCLLMGTLLLFAKQSSAQIAGSGDKGANRRVVAGGGGYASVAGRFLAPAFSVPIVNTNRSKPTFYLGARATQLEIDAGYQWESEAVVGRNRVIEPPGWSRFIRVTNAFTPPKGIWYNTTNVADKRPQLVGSVWLQFDINESSAVPHSVTLTGSGIDTFSFSRNIAGYPLSDGQIKQMDVKRVVGITQETFKLDDSWSHNNVFSGGKIAMWRRNSSGKVVRDGLGYGLRDWINSWPSSKNIREFEPTGRDGAKNWIVEFAPPYKRANDATGTTPDVLARYSNETVHINLLSKSWSLPLEVES